jgi:hypothetical protein
MTLETTRLKQELANPEHVLAALGLLRGARRQSNGFWIPCPRCGQDLSVRRVPHRGGQSPLMVTCQKPRCTKGDIFMLLELYAPGGFREQVSFARRLAKHISTFKKAA